MTNRENPIHRIKSYLGSGSGSKSKWYGSETLVTSDPLWKDGNVRFTTIPFAFFLIGLDAGLVYNSFPKFADRKQIKIKTYHFFILKNALRLVENKTRILPVLSFYFQNAEWLLERPTGVFGWINNQINFDLFCLDNR